MSEYSYKNTPFINIFLNNGTSSAFGSILNNIVSNYNEKTNNYYFTSPFGIANIANSIDYSSINDDLGNKLSPLLYVYLEGASSITIPTGVTYMNIISIGGGGGGTSGSATSGGNGRGGGGGSSGGISVTLGLPYVSGVNTLSVIIGSGGTAGRAQTGNGNPIIGTDGGDSYITYNSKNYCIAKGGAKGTSNTNPDGTGTTPGLWGVGGKAPAVTSTDRFSLNNTTYNYNTRGNDGSSSSTVRNTDGNRRYGGGAGGLTPALTDLTSNSLYLIKNSQLSLYYKNSSGNIGVLDLSTLTRGDGGSGGASDYDAGGVYGLAGSPGVNGLVIIYYIFTPILFTPTITP